MEAVEDRTRMTASGQARANLSAASQRRWSRPDEKELYSYYGKRNMHRRWHENRGVTKSDCAFCTGPTNTQ